ncbi:hypothetical protein A3D04_01190 [Candidatus Curtissbacteria bacterium RIFCSPHIGHO2_02_FULL_40_16b]|uniref:Uncharacterized protein n=1 Tax=Candidatus Curtissbacteria bacterium RIFCSPHIGHO2_02_FULL_40_16b TaxID=1797714 RepID=A0A1F5G9R4_9BACT|nr:MAG: hypothetical protein A3D04_01190 [Candidatus Curtissbacteria bacterium RIFCSPHIGHO2_02_FULL_40_16b]
MLQTIYSREEDNRSLSRVPVQGFDYTRHGVYYPTGVGISQKFPKIFDKFYFTHFFKEADLNKALCTRKTSSLEPLFQKSS